MVKTQPLPSPPLSAYLVLPGDSKVEGLSWEVPHHVHKVSTPQGQHTLLLRQSHQQVLDTGESARAAIRGRGQASRGRQTGRRAGGAMMVAVPKVPPWAHTEGRPPSPPPNPITTITTTTPPNHCSHGKHNRAGAPSQSWLWQGEGCGGGWRMSDYLAAFGNTTTLTATRPLPSRVPPPPPSLPSTHRPGCV